ncbi:DNA (cytosine-5-)-methyltransferase [Marinicella sp. S1101]|uniref:DNA (cytosine-5-)-methyltransferase n=1 Tax=Marinicella marina TaxID=2996016 RepID=UPI002260D796|nr:DNA (cytosine-5-)-methyltransferase [Marinicella marina]MCX7554846.1 DNA (cytosine-5-)-methyltransferase [Marinicella marina]MDJ1141504.1 DNA (cytosine-5-)-methyltransferase [Marinicella marina]
MNNLTRQKKVSEKVKVDEIMSESITNTKKFKFIDLFAGIGGFHIAMHQNGGECVFASEMDKFARITYEKNFKDISPEVFKNGNFNVDITDTELDYSDIPDFDVLCAGFPCQPFSQAGLKKGFNDTRGTLFFNIQEIIKTKVDANKADSAVKVPKVILLENVKGFRNHDKGNTYATIVRVLNKLGYEVRSSILNSKHFGVPQNRERLFIVAWNRTVINAEEFKFPLGLTENEGVIFNKNALHQAKTTELNHILLSNNELAQLEKEANKTYTISEKLWSGHKRRKLEHKKKGNGFGYSLFNGESKYTSTISARYYKDGSEILIDQSKLSNRPSRPRKIHPIEAARLQGFPIDDWYEIPVSDNQAYKQFGNSVSVPVVNAIAIEIKRQLL